MVWMIRCRIPNHADYNRIAVAQGGSLRWIGSIEAGFLGTAGASGIKAPIVEITASSEWEQVKAEAARLATA